MQYSIYLRKSRADLEAEAHGEGETLLRHEKRLLELANKMRLNVVKIYREVASGESISARPVMKQLLKDVETGMYDGVLVVEVERLARGDTSDQGIVAKTFKYSDTKIITPFKTYDPNNEYDEEFFEFGLFMSRREYKSINRRLQSGRMSSILEGKYVGNTPPYGYSRVKLDNQKGYSLKIIENQAEIVRLIFKMSLDGLGYSKIVHTLNEMHVPTLKGGVWSIATIRGILDNPVYIGKIRWNRRKVVTRMIDGEKVTSRPRSKDYLIVPGLHEPIIDSYTWENTRKSKKYIVPVKTDTTLKNPLAGIVICGICGKAMVRKQFKQQNTRDILLCSNVECTNRSNVLEVVESRLIDSLEEWLTDYKIKLEVDNINDNLEAANIALSGFDADIEKLEKQLNNMYDLLEQGVYDTELFLKRSKTVNEALEKVKKDREAILDTIQKELDSRNSIYHLAPKIENVISAYKMTNDPYIKNNLLKSILNKVEYVKKDKRYIAPDSFELTLFPKL